MIKGYTDTALTAPCCRGGGGDVFRDKKGEIASEGFISTAIIPDPGTERRKPRERQAGRQAGAEAEREEKRRGGSVNTKGGGKNLDTIPS